MELTMIGAYGPWAASIVGDTIPSMSFRRDEWADVEAWRLAARARLVERLAPPEVTTPDEVEVVDRVTYDGLDVERLRWRLAYGPATEAVVLKPVGATGRLPGVLGLHDHSGVKYWGKRKIARWGEPHPMAKALQDHAYGGKAWANELARRGYVVLVHDAFAFGSRRVLAEDCSEAIRGDVPVPSDDDHASIDAYNAWAARHETYMARSLFCAGTTWPGVFWQEDRVALDILARRDDVDAARLGCGGLSGGGLRTCLLGGLDDRIKAAVCAGFMSTWRDFALHKNYTHTWMLYVPVLPVELDYPEILGLRAPAPTMVMHCTEDKLFSMAGVRDSERILQAVYGKAGGEGNVEFKYYPGHHKFDAPMQADAFAFFDGQLKG